MRDRSIIEWPMSQKFFLKLYWLIFFYSGGHQPGSFVNINSGARFPHTVQHDIDSLDLIGKLAKPEAKITIVQAVGNGNGLISASKLVNQMKLAGLITVQEPRTLQSLSSDQLKKIREILSIPEADIFEIGEIRIKLEWKKYLLFDFFFN